MPHLYVFESFHSLNESGIVKTEEGKILFFCKGDDIGSFILWSFEEKYSEFSKAFIEAKTIVMNDDFICAESCNFQYFLIGWIYKTILIFKEHFIVSC